MLTALLFSLHAAAAPPFDLADWRRHASPADVEAARSEYAYARARWTDDDTLRSFVRRDRIGRVWGEDDGSLESSPWSDSNAFEREITQAADALLRLELRWAERLGLEPAQVWAHFYILENDEIRLVPRPKQTRLEDLKSIEAEVREISPSLANWLARFVTDRFEVFADRAGPEEDEAAWRQRVWAESQLYDHRSEDGSTGWYKWLRGPDPTARLVRLETDVGERFGLPKRVSWELVYHLLHSWEEYPWTSLYRRRQFAPEPAGWRDAMLKGIRAINGLAYRRLVGHLAFHEEDSRKFSVVKNAPPWAIEAAESAFAKRRSEGPVDAAVTERFEAKIAGLRARRPHHPLEIDPDVADELGARLLAAREYYQPCARALERPSTALERFVDRLDPRR